MKRVGCYFRVSTSEQDVGAQRNDALAYCKARGWDTVSEYSDTGISGTRERRPGLDRLLSDVKARRLDVVVVAAFDRFGRSVRHLVETLELFRHLGVEFVSLRDQIDTAARAGSVHHHRRHRPARTEPHRRTRAGLRRARAEGKRLGRPPVQIDPVRHANVIRRQLSVREASRELGVSPSSYARLVRGLSIADGNGAPRVSSRSRRGSRRLPWSC